MRVRWKEGGIPEVQGTLVSDVAEIKLTEKGYFIYAFEYEFLYRMKYQEEFPSEDYSHGIPKEKFHEDGSFQYLGNEILNDGINDIPDYQYRIRTERVDFLI